MKSSRLCSLERGVRELRAEYGADVRPRAAVRQDAQEAARAAADRDRPGVDRVDAGTRGGRST